MVTMKHAGREDTLMLLHVASLHRQIQLRLEASNTLSLGSLWYKEKSENTSSNSQLRRTRRIPGKHFGYMVQAFLLDIRQHQMMEVACSQVHKEHSMLPAPPPQTIRPTSQTHMQSHESESLQGALTSFHKGDSKQLIAQGLPENIPYSALPGTPKAISAKVCPHSLCSLRAVTGQQKQSPWQTSQ